MYSRESTQYKLKYILFLFVFIFLFKVKTVNAQVVINEINPSGEWVELYKISSGAVVLENCIIYFQDTKSQKKTLTVTDNFSESDIYKVITTDGSYLNNSSSDTVLLECPDFNLGPVSYGDNIGSKSYARVPNGSGSFQNIDQITQGLQNPDPTPEPTIVPTQTATSLPTATVTLTPTPIKTITPQPTSKPLPTKTSTPKPSPTPTSDPEETNEPEADGNNESLNNSSGDNKIYPEPTGQVAGVTYTKKTPIIAIIFMFLGVCCLGYVGYMLYNVKHNND